MSMSDEEYRRLYGPTVADLRNSPYGDLMKRCGQDKTAALLLLARYRWGESTAGSVGLGIGPGGPF